MSFRPSVSLSISCGLQLGDKRRSKTKFGRFFGVNVSQNRSNRFANFQLRRSKDNVKDKGQGHTSRKRCISRAPRYGRWIERRRRVPLHTIAQCGGRVRVTMWSGRPHRMSPHDLATSFPVLINDLLRVRRFCCCSVAQSRGSDCVRRCRATSPTLTMTTTMMIVCWTAKCRSYFTAAALSLPCSRRRSCRRRLLTGRPTSVCANPSSPPSRHRRG